MIIRDLLIRLGFVSKTKPLDKAESSLVRFKKALFSVKTVLAGVAAGVIGFALKEAGEFEQLEIAFETMLKSADKAKALLDDIADFAATTPFELKEISNASKKLLAFGIEANDIVDTMTRLGDIASGVGKEKLGSIILAFGKIKTKGKASMEELNILLEAGVPILDELAKGFGVSTQELFKMVSAGKVGFKEVNTAISGLSTGAGKFAGLMARQSKSFFGIISNIKDELSAIGREVGKELLPDAKAAAKTLLKLMKAGKKPVIAFIRVFLNGFRSLIKIVDRGKIAFLAAGAALAIMQSAAIIRGFVALGSTVGGFVTKNFKRLSKVLSGVSLKLFLIPLAIALIVDDLVAFSQGRGSVFEDLIKGFVVVAQIVEKVFNFIQTKVTQALGFIGIEIAAFIDTQFARLKGIKKIGAAFEGKSSIQGFIAAAKLIKRGETFKADPADLARIQATKTRAQESIKNFNFNFNITTSLNANDITKLFRDSLNSAFNQSGFASE